jgi:septum formation protein
MGPPHARVLLWATRMGQPVWASPYGPVRIDQSVWAGPYRSANKALDSAAASVFGRIGQFIPRARSCMLRGMQKSSNPLIYLASASPRRSTLLSQVGIPHSVRPVDIDENIQIGETPEGYVRRLAVQKACALWAQLDPAERLPVLGADTSVAIDDEIMGKPADERDCARMLRRLSARTHRVYTAIALRHDGGCEERLSISDVSFRALNAAEISAYWRSGEPAGKAGSYAVQGIAALFIDRIAGSFSGIMGLPLFETGELLGRVGWGVQQAVAE